MPNWLKNVSGRTLVIGDLKLSWPKEHVFDMDDFDNERLVKAFEAIKYNIEQGWLVPVDRQGNLIKKKFNFAAHPPCNP